MKKLFAFAAALALGADGVNVGTRFMVTQESPIHDDIKRALADSTILATLSRHHPMAAMKRARKPL